MKIPFWFTAAALLTVGAGAYALSTTQDKKAAEAGAHKDDPMMAKWMEFATPGDAHKLLATMVGKWNLKVKMFEPNKPPTEEPATSESKMILGGRYLEDHTRGTFMGQPFEGQGITGYDNLKKKYCGTWVDNFGTGIMPLEGTYDASTKTFTYASESPDVMTGKYTKSRMVDKITDNDHWTMQMFGNGPDGKEMMMMEIDYTRAK